MEIRHSIKLEDLLKTRIQAAYDCAEGKSVSNADDPDNAFKMFRNGAELGAAAHSVGLNIFYGQVQDVDSTVTFYLMALLEEEACAEVSSWDEDEEDGDEFT
jgi:hypothetical protein